MEVKMHHSSIGDAFAALLGIIGSFITMDLAGISWQWIFDNATQNKYVTVQSDGSNWIIIGNN